MSQPLPFPSFLLLSNPHKSGSTENILAPRCPIATLTRLSTRACEEPSNHDSTVRHPRGLKRLLKKWLLVTLYNTGDMAVTVEMQNTGDSRTRREILAGVEHVLSDVAGDWRVSIVGSRANDNWEMKVEGPRGFERSYTLVGEVGEHQPEAIRNLLIKL